MQLLFKIKDGTPLSTATVGNTDFKGHYESINKNVGFVSLQTAIRKVTRDIVLPLLGEELYNDLATSYHEAQMVGDPEGNLVLGDPINGIILGIGELRAEEFELLNLLRDAIAEYTIWHSASYRLIQYGDAGMRVGTDGGDTNARSPSTWEIAHYFWKVMREADKHMDMVLAYLDSHQDAFPLWVTYKATDRTSKLFIRRTMELHEIVPISESRRTFLKIRPFMERIQPKVRDILGPTLYASLLAAYQAEDMDANQMELLPYVQRVIAWNAVLDALPTMAVFIEDEGIRTMTSADGFNSKQVMQQERLDALKRDYENHFAESREELITFLWKNTTTYPDWKEGEVYLDTQRSDGQGTPYTFGPGAVFLV